MREMIRNGEWRHTALVLVLLVLGGLAAKYVISVLAVHLPIATDEASISRLTFAAIALISGFLFLVGAFGIWAIQSTVANEGRKQIGRLVDDMDYLTDGMIVVDHVGTVNGMNSAARTFAAHSDTEEIRIDDLFPCLTFEDVESLLLPNRSMEVERVLRSGQALYSLRFRSQPSQDMNVIVVSDVTAMKSRQLRDMQISHFQLIGRIARGVAHDFNNLLCAISANAALIDRPAVVEQIGREAIDTIVDQSTRGADLAHRLLQLSGMESEGVPMEQVGAHAEQAVDLVRIALSSLWSVRFETEDKLPEVPITGSQFEQILANLCLHAAEEIGTPGQLRIELRAAGWERKRPREIAITVAATPPGVVSGVEMGSQKHVRVEDAGVIESVIRSVIEGVGGRMDIYSLYHGHDSYRLIIPAVSANRDRATALTGLPSELTDSIDGLRVLIARGRDAAMADLEQRFIALGLDVESVFELILVLGRMEKSFPFDTLVVDRRLLGDSAEAVLKAMIKLKPSVGIVVLSGEPDQELKDLTRDIVFTPFSSPAYDVMNAMARARAIAEFRGEKAIPLPLPEDTTSAEDR